MNHWHRFAALALGTAGAAIAVTFLFVALVDPYDQLPIHLPIERQRVTGNERYTFPAIIRSGRYDSAVFGTSTMMLLAPGRLSERFGGKFANLGMGSATAWEQVQVLSLFARHVRFPRVVVVGMDTTWCQTRKTARLTFRPFPPWQYDENPWNDYLHLLNTRAIVHAARQLGVAFGLLSTPFGADGYYQFVPDDSQYDAERARRNIYGETDGRPLLSVEELRDALNGVPQSRAFPDQAMLWPVLESLPAETTKILMFPPYHATMFAGSAGQWRLFARCKQAVVEAVQGRPGYYVVDFMVPSPITTDDHRYWDSLHYNIATAAEVVDLLYEAISSGQNGKAFLILARPGRRSFPQEGARGPTDRFATPAPGLRRSGRRR